MEGVQNPYAPPEQDEPAPLPASAVELLDATRGARFANLMLDYFGRMLLTYLLDYVLGVFGFDTLLVFSGVVMLVGYHLVFEYTLGRTPAKFITGTRVVTNTGTHPRFSQIFGRTLARYIPFEPLSFLGSTPTGWHDRLSGTRVIKIRSTSQD